MRLHIYHNVTQNDDGRLVAQFDGYEPGHLLTKVHELEVTDGADWLAACDYAWGVFNVGHDAEPPHPAAVSYRERDNRSLSVGDVIEMNGDWFAAMSAGWGEILPVPDKSHIVEKVIHGTTPASLTIIRCTRRAWMRGEVRACRTVLDQEGNCHNADRHMSVDAEVQHAIENLNAVAERGVGDPTTWLTEEMPRRHGPRRTP